MRRLRRLWRTTPHEWRLLLEALVLVIRIRIALRVLPFQRVQAAYARRSVQPDHAAGDPAVDVGEAKDVGAAVQRASRLVPGATCLPRALATRVMLERRGLPNALRFGVARSTAGAIEAHAWIEVDGVVVVGQLPDLGRYHRLPDLPDALR